MHCTSRTNATDQRKPHEARSVKELCALLREWPDVVVTTRRLARYFSKTPHELRARETLDGPAMTRVEVGAHLMRVSRHEARPIIVVPFDALARQIWPMVCSALACTGFARIEFEMSDSRGEGEAVPLVCEGSKDASLGDSKSWNATLDDALTVVLDGAIESLIYHRSQNVLRKAKSNLEKVERTCARQRPGEAPLEPSTWARTRQAASAHRPISTSRSRASPPSPPSTVTPRCRGTLRSR